MNETTLEALDDGGATCRVRIEPVASADVLLNSEP
jgi:hypothetical protein